MERIFVQIASYRDPECQWTVKDLFAKATYPDRVFVGICWQYDPQEDADCFQHAARPHQVRVAPFHWKESQGVCWARAQTQQLWDGEEYTFTIDSHMRFEQGWDERFITELAECPSPDAILTNHPASYTPPDNLEKGVMPTILRAHPYSPEGDIRFRGDFLDRLPDKPLRGAFIAAGLMFSRSNVITEVPYDPYLYFNQEEISLAARFFTHGFDVYSPREVLVYHYYNPAPDKKKRPLHWDDNKNWTELQDRARQRLNHLLGHTPNDDPIVTRDLMKYGLGHVRSLKEFEAFCGIDFARREVSERALRCGFIENLSLYKDKPIYIPEIDGTIAAQPRTAPVTVKLAASNVTGPVLSFPDPAVSAKQPFDAMTLADGRSRKLNVLENAPRGVLVITDYLEKPVCDALARYADAQIFTELNVVDHEKSTKDAIVQLKHEGRITHHVDIDGMACEILNIFNDIYCHRLAPFYNVNFEWYERPQILRYPAGGKYNQHADADHWVADKKKWQRVQDRDYSVLIYLNDEYEGGELQLIEQNFTIKPTPGMLLAFPSDHRYLHAALPTTSGIRYAVVSWAAVLGTQRVRTQPPYASVFVRQKRTA
jgi:predicted 2-oxoglutarate/Fe(II)-dependent dioxygenase YbiX